MTRPKESKQTLRIFTFFRCGNGQSSFLGVVEDTSLRTNTTGDEDRTRNQNKANNCCDVYR
uniref:Uncharacterized protein n=1 Tax=Arundo donax TaxID=35708 RepID=A0A0A9F2T8_ARUDO